MSDERFSFGKNWQSFLATLDERRIAAAARSLRETLQTDSLAGQRFLDIGCGSGLFSLAAQRLGAEVTSLDFDADSVACTAQLKARYGQPAPPWYLHRGSVLDESWLASLGRFQVVYAWGVLHHTGDLARAICLAAERTAPGGKFCIAIYNDQGAASLRWLRIKQFYHRLPRLLRPLWVGAIATYYESKFALSRATKFRNPLPLDDWRRKREDRGMSVWHDWVDWVGGLPFEVATPAKVESLLIPQGYTLERADLIGRGWGCNEFVFRRGTEVAAPPT
jgi:2-polyprenyl-6-hydroxyphenyl methylase/3-demethylubiquinone-9 3-methyltransferase